MSLQSGKGTYFCRSCLWPTADPRSERCPYCAKKSHEFRMKISGAIKNSPAYQKAMRSPELREKRKKNGKAYFENHLEAREKSSWFAIKGWAIPGAREKRGKIIKNSLAYQIGIKSEENREKHSGPRSHAWRGGIAHKSYEKEFNAGFRAMIRKRDDYLCQNPTCYLPENGRKHAIHHVDYDKKNIDPVNLITLCIVHHGKTILGNRDYWIRYYQALQEMRFNRA